MAGTSGTVTARNEARPARDVDDSSDQAIRTGGGIGLSAYLAKKNEVARFASEYRDSRLLAAIREGLAEHDRVVVVFGGWHVLALEPVIENP